MFEVVEDKEVDDGDNSEDGELTIGTKPGAEVVFKEVAVGFGEKPCNQAKIRGVDAGGCRCLYFQKNGKSCSSKITCLLMNTRPDWGRRHL